MLSLSVLREPSVEILQLIIVGYGNIGRYWLTHFAPQLPKQLSGGIGVAAVLNSKGVVAEQGLPASLLTSRVWQPHQMATAVEGPSTEAHVLQLLAELDAMHNPVAVVDLTASKAVSRFYPTWVRAGAHLICANKYAGSSAMDFYTDLRAALASQQRFWLCNTTVGAGLPILSTIAERLVCQDEILVIEGNLSGSLSWIFQQYRAGQRFSSWLRKAAELGMTEPDPRMDLAGMDVARKLLILARESGWQLELADLQIENLIPMSLRHCSLAEFWQRAAELDESVAQRPGPQFHYLGRIEKTAAGKIVGSARLQAIDADSTYANLPPGNANFVIQSRQYCANPLLIQGPGAGREVTAAGVHSDIVVLQRQLWGTSFAAAAI